MEVADILDIDGNQWEIQDAKARNRIEEVVVENSKIIDIILDGTFIFNAKMKYLGEDETYKYYNFWWGEQNGRHEGILSSIEVIPRNTNTDKILNLNMNILQIANASITQHTQHSDGPNNSGMLTYINGASANPQWIISGMGILRRKK